MAPERVLLSSIRTLTFYADSATKARRTSPIPQLTCIGSPCKLYTPDAIQCFNVGGDGTDVNWKCEADLPEALRFGRVNVSCEGWSKPGDPYVLKGSCGLEYRLVRVPTQLYNNEKVPHFISRWLSQLNTATVVLHSLWIAVLMYMLYKIIRSCMSSRDRASRPDNSRPSRPQTPRNPPGSGGWGSGWFGGSPGNNDPRRPPPPYSKHPNSQSDGNWNPGFWTGLGLGGAGGYLLSNQRQQQQQPPPQPFRQTWDWERERPSSWLFTSTRSDPPPQENTAGSRSWQAYGGGEGSSDLGPLRRSTGVGESTVR